MGRKGRKRRKKSPFAAYVKRNEVLRGLGFESYADYQKSELWATIRARVLHQKRCYGCGGTATSVHHLAYTRENLTGDTLAGMVAICRKCHEAIEFDGERKLSLHEANRRLEAMRCGKKAPVEKPKEEKPLGPEYDAESDSPFLVCATKAELMRGSHDRTKSRRNEPRARTCQYLDAFRSGKVIKYAEPLIVTKGTPIQTRALRQVWDKWKSGKMPALGEFTSAVSRTKQYFVFVKGDMLIKVLSDHVI